MCEVDIGMSEEDDSDDFNYFSVNMVTFAMVISCRCGSMSHSHTIACLARLIIVFSFGEKKKEARF